MDRLVLDSYAKVNLYLEVLSKRRDNYHNIKTVFERIGLCDRIILKSRRDKKIKLICNRASDMPTGASNLAYRSAKLLQDTFDIDKGVDIKIIKNIPVGSGLGGGSSNAATVLIGLNKLWGLNLRQEGLLRLAKKLGSDVPFFIYNCPFAQGEGRGEKIKPLRTLNKLRFWHILVVPKIKVLTPLIYKQWDAASKYTKKSKDAALTRSKQDVKILHLALRTKNLSLMQAALFNRLQEITIKLYPRVKRVKERFIHLGAKTILMSGSGPAVFGVVHSRKEAVSLYNQLQGNSFWRVFITRTR